MIKMKQGVVEHITALIINIVTVPTFCDQIEYFTVLEPRNPERGELNVVQVLEL